MAKLTELAVRSAKPTEDGKPRKIFDAEGLYLRVLKSGAKQWRYRFKINRQERHMGLGSYPAISLAKARELHKEARTLLKQGIDPIDARTEDKTVKEAKREAQTYTFEVVARDWLAAVGKSWTEKTRARVASQMERWVFPHIGSKAMTEITTPMLTKVLDNIAANGRAYTAHKQRTYIRRVFNRAIVREIGGIEHNPVDPIDSDTMETAPAAANRAALLEPARVGEVLRLMDGYHAASPQVSAAMKLAPLFFVRPGELRRMKWEEVDFEASEWTFLSTKKGKIHTVPLCSQALEILRALKAFTGASEYCFPNPKRGHKPDRPTISENAVLDGIRRLGVSADEMSPHGWRATARTLLVEQLGERPDIVRHQMSHRVLDPNGTAYDRTTFIAERHKMMQRWADYLDGLKAGGNVISADFRKSDSATAS